MVKTRQGWVLLSPLELLAVEVVGGAMSALVVGGAASVVGGAASVVGRALGSGISSGVDGVRCTGSGVPGSGGCDVIRGCSDSDHMANGSGHIVGKVL
eukprot:g13711.t1